MDAAVCNPSLGPSSSSSSSYVSSRPSFCPDLRRSSVRLSSEVFKVKIGRLERSLCRSSGNKLSAVIASASQTSVSDPISTPSRNDLSDSLKKSNEASLILIRHGESLWNEKNLFTGSVDVPLTKKGVEEAIQAGERISNIPVDMIYTSSLIRAQMTAMLAMTEHRQQKIEPQLFIGKNVMIAAHGNSLRSIIMYLDKLTTQEVISLELSTGVPLLYIFKEGRFVRRGSPVGPTEAGVYAYTGKLAQYRQKLDEMSH